MTRRDNIDDGPAAEWTLTDLFAILVRRRRWIAGALGLFCAMALLYALCATPRFRATAVIEVEKQSHGAFGLDNTTSDAQATALSDSFDDNLTLQTEIGILESDAVTLEVIRRTRLEETADYFGARPGGSAWLRNAAAKVFFWRRPVEPLSVPLEDAPNRRYAALKIFARHSRIAVASGTRLVAIEYSDRDPVRSSAVVNALVQSLGDYRYQSRSSAAAQSAVWLQAQLASVRQQTDALDAQAAALDRQAGAFGDDDGHNVVLARLDELNAALAAAQSNRIVREAIWRAVESGDPETISGLAGDAGASANTQNSFALLQSLRGQEASAKAQIAASADRYGENWPALAEQRASLENIQKSIQDEIRRLGDRAHNDYTVAAQAEDSARTAFEQQKGLASSLTGNAVSLRLARQQAEASRALYTSLQNRLQQTGVLEGLHSANFVVVTPAMVPPPNHPSSPNVPLLAALAVAGGLASGCMAAVARELTDSAIHCASDLESLVQAPVFAELPPQREPRTIVGRMRRLLLPDQGPALALEAAAASDYAIPEPESPYVEALHRLRASLLLVRSERAPQVIAVIAATLPERTSPSPQLRSCVEEPHPSFALNLAAVLAQYGAKVLFVDADLRAAPTAGAGLAAPGLTDALTGNAATGLNHVAPGRSLADDRPALLSVLLSGARPPCPAELVASARMKSLLAQWRQEFEFVVIDGPPAVYADSLVLAHQADAILLTALAGRTRQEAIASAYNALQRQASDRAVLGVVLEDASQRGRYASA